MYCPSYFYIGPQDFNHFDSYLNCSLAFNTIVNYLIPSDINYTHACRTPITKIQTPRVNTHQISYIAATITSSIELNIIYIQQIGRIQVNHVAQVPLHAIWLWCQQKTVYSSCDHAYRHNMSGSDVDKRIRTVASIVQGLHQWLMPLLNNYRNSSLT
jgi:hypothetical protein